MILSFDAVHNMRLRVYCIEASDSRSRSSLHNGTLHGKVVKNGEEAAPRVIALPLLAIKPDESGLRSAAAAAHIYEKGISRVCRPFARSPDRCPLSLLPSPFLRHLQRPFAPLPLSSGSDRLLRFRLAAETRGRLIKLGLTVVRLTAKLQNDVL